MGMRYAIPPGARLRVLTTSGNITVTAEERPDLAVDSGGRHPHVEQEDGVVEVKTRSSSLNIRCPRGINVSVGVMSGSVRLVGEFGSVKVSAVSGHVDVDSASGDVDVRGVSGHLTVNRCGGSCQLNTKSGHITIGWAEKDARASTVSGSVEMSVGGGGDVAAKSISGNVIIRVPAGKQPRTRLRSLSGRIRCECPTGSDFDLEASTLSGRIEVETP